MVGTVVENELQEIMKFYITNESRYFGGAQSTLEESKFVVIGVPYDATVTFKPGARFAPAIIRYASQNIESYSFRAQIDFDQLKVHDAGDLTTLSSTAEVVRGVEKVVRALTSMKKTVVVIGGEHTVTYGAVKALEKCGVIVFDAHLDLRDEYPPGVKLSHATVVRRIVELAPHSRVLCIGTRATCDEEIKYVKDHGLTYITTREIWKNGLEAIVKKIRKIISHMNADHYWLSIDIDVLDPSIAPEVSNPEPEGITMTQLLDIIAEIVSEKVVGFDVVELSTQKLTSQSAIVAAKIIFELMCLIHKSKQTNKRLITL